MDNGEKKSGLRFDIAESGGLVFDGADENADTNEADKPSSC